MKHSKWLAALLAATVLVSGLAGCAPSPAAPASSPQSSAGEPSSMEESSAPTDRIMDFSQKLTLKKPAKPIPEEPFILMLGNSYIYTNEMPIIFESLSSSGGINASVFEYSDGGYHLSYFADPEDDLGEMVAADLAEYEWDYVVMQEQSSLPTDKELVESEMIPAVKALDEMVKGANGQSALLMTWAYKNGNEDNGTTREEMQTALVEGYTAAADSVGALLSPAGIAFMRCAEAHPEIELWDAEDGMHPTMPGTYLAACVLYATLYDQSPVGIEYAPEGTTPEMTAILQQIAADVVLG